jgi:glycosyltransferase involved in cell wall biosynthesis
MKRHIFILVPAPLPTGPVKGAYALANALAQTRSVTVVTLRSGPGADAPLDPSVRQVSLAEQRGFWRKLRAYRELLRAAGGRKAVASISMCFSADTTNVLCSEYAVTCASVRGNLIQNYRMDYGVPGIGLAVTHLLSLRGADHVVAMTRAMAQQVRRFAGGDVAVISNFVDEAALERFRAPAPADGPLCFVFLGSLTRRKQPLALVRSVKALREGGVDARAVLIGDGPLAGEIRGEVARESLTEHVAIHGFLAQPYTLLASADALVLPSLSEGLSRACMEALHLGVPCVARAVDGNGELIRTGVNGVLFGQDEQIVPAMRQAAQLSRSLKGMRSSLLPAEFRQAAAARSYLDLVER